MSKRRLMTDPRLSASGTTARRAAKPVQPRLLTALIRMSALAVVLAGLAGVHEVHAACIDGNIGSCSSGGQAGTRECVDGEWGPCEVTEPAPPIDAPPIDAPPACGPLSPVVRITKTTPIRCFIEALAKANNLVLLAHDLNLDLTGYANISIAGGVTLTSDAPPIGHAPPTVAAVRRPILEDPWKADSTARDASHLGPLVYTRLGPHQAGGSNLFEIRCFPPDGVRNDGVRIAGFRLRGPSYGQQSIDEFAIHIDHCINIEISNMEIAGWGGAAINVNDEPWEGQPAGWITQPSHVRIFQNFIHHNQHPSKDGHSGGYGVNVNIGAWAEITENVFDFNRHAIAASGDAGGYDAMRNLVLKGGGYHGTIVNTYTHQFDVHGTETCGFGHLDCGNAGERVVYARNAFQYEHDHAIKIRGRPKESIEIVENVFPHGALENDRGLDAINLQTEENITIADNVLNVDTYGDYGVCDFDGDGIDDLFLATGVTWWYASGGQMHWTYLREATERWSQVGLGDFDNDGRCDVFAVNRAAQQWEIAKGGSGAWTALPGTYDIPFEALRFGDFNGDGIMDIFHRAPDGQWSAISPGFYNWRLLASSSFAVHQLRFGDFDADGVTDVVAVQGGRWSVSWGGTRAWEELNPRLRDPLEGLLIGDIDADGRDDILRYTPAPDGIRGTWEISWGGRTGWEQLATFTWENIPPLRPANDVRTVVGRFNAGAAWTGYDVLAIDAPQDWLRMGHLYSHGQGSFTPHSLYAY